MMVVESGQCVALVESGSLSLVHNAQRWSTINTGCGGLTLAQISGWYSHNSDLEITKDLHWTA